MCSCVGDLLICQHQNWDASVKIWLLVLEHKCETALLYIYRFSIDCHSYFRKVNETQPTASSLYRICEYSLILETLTCHYMHA
jgi:hypothetical protein